MADSHVTAPVLVALASGDWSEIIPNGNNHVRCGEIAAVHFEAVDVDEISVVVCTPGKITQKSRVSGVRTGFAARGTYGEVRVFCATRWKTVSAN